MRSHIIFVILIVPVYDGQCSCYYYSIFVFIAFVCKCCKADQGLYFNLIVLLALSLMPIHFYK